ncbi:MAG: CheR family methyltransferase, partial [Rhizomicrobium sp.]
MAVSPLSRHTPARQHSVAAEGWQPERVSAAVAPLSQANFIRLARFVYDYCGIRITEKKRTMLDSRLRRRMRVLGIADINGYCEYLFGDDDANAETEVIHFIDAITTNKTDFYRESAHFDYLRAKILPHLAEAGQHTIRIWCAASSIGAEPYTLAMELEDFCQPRPGVSYNIVATDICTEVLLKAVNGRYPIPMMEPIPEDRRRKYIMLPRDPMGQEFRIVPRLRAKVSFQHLNLMDDRYPLDRNFDVI